MISCGAPEPAAGNGECPKGEGYLGDTVFGMRVMAVADDGDEMALEVGPDMLMATGVKNSFVIGAGGASAFLDSAAPGPNHITSRSNTAILNIQEDANLCINVYADAKHSNITSRYCLGAPVCPCAPVCKGKDKLPPFCNHSSAAGYKLVITAGNLCVKDTAADINRWCALKEPATGVGGNFYMMLADDGSICLHAGSYSATSPANR